jgi:hypothetical protein
MLGYADYALTTALPIDEVRHRIERHLLIWRFGEPPRKAIKAPAEVFFIGKVDDNTFRLHLHKPDSESTCFAVARGRLTAQDGGTLVVASSGPDRGVWFMAGLFSLFGLPCLVGAATLPFYEGFGWPFVSSLAIGFAFTGVPALILWLGRTESFALRDKLAAVIEAGVPAADPPRSGRHPPEPPSPPPTPTALRPAASSGRSSP